MIVDDDEATPSPWYCPYCESWVGRKRDQCANGHSRPRLPLYYDDVEFDYSPRVTNYQRLRSKIWRVIGR